MINLNALQQIIEKYKTHFHEINHDEIYKWSAVRYFKKHWNPEDSDVKMMLLNALDKTSKLMDSGSYFPKRMLTIYLNAEPQTVKNLFLQLYDESRELRSRIEHFEAGMESLRKSYSPEKKHFQDTRAIMVYLTLKYPEQYFLYKFEMFAAFAKLVSYPFSINKRNRIDNVLLYQDLCKVVRQQVLADNDLIKLHYSRLRPEDYADTNYNLLTQDIIYATTKHFEDTYIEEELSFDIQLISDQAIQPLEVQTKLQARKIDYIEKVVHDKWIGDLGEWAILKYETKKLEKAGIAKKPEPVSKTQGDGCGYDILSYDLDGKPIYIEVKTSRSKEAAFYITQAELVMSLAEKDRYRLYRLYDFDEKGQVGKLIIYKGSLERFCINPLVYYVPYQLK